MCSFENKNLFSLSELTKMSIYKENNEGKKVTAI